MVVSDVGCAVDVGDTEYYLDNEVVPRAESILWILWCFGDMQHNHSSTAKACDFVDRNLTAIRDIAG